MTSRVAGGAAFVVLSSAACDPLLNVAGSFFPAWMVAILVGVALTVVARLILVVAGLEPHLGPPVLIYPSLGLLLTVATWLVLYRA